MKKTYFAIIIVCFSVAYYFGIYLPKTHNIEMQERCAKLAKEFFKENYQSALAAQVDYECHYNKKLNKFFILMTDVNYLDNGKTRITHRTLKDILENKVCAVTTDDSGDRVISNSPMMRGQNKIIEEYMRE